MNSEKQMDALELAQVNYKEYSLYVGRGRAYPALKDGCKSSYKRAIYGMHLNNPHKTVKVAELAAYALPYHPHPTSISGVIVQLGDKGNKLGMMVTQGNWGDSSKKILPSADRYIGGFLSPLAEHLLCDSVEYSNFVKGEIDKDEPEALPSLLPLCFINGLQGIPSGLPTLNIPTIDIDGMLDYYMDVLMHKDLAYVPKKLPKPNLEINVVSSREDWNNILLTGKGSLRVAPIMKFENGIITITALPRTKNMDHIRKILEKEILLDKIDVRDESTRDTCIVIEKVPYKQCDMKELYNRLYTKLQSSDTYNMAFFDEDLIYVPCGFDKVVKSNLQYVINTQMNRISKQLQETELKLKVLEIIEGLKKSSKIKKLAEMTSEEALEYIANEYKTTKEIAVKVFQKPLSYLTKEHNQELLDLKSQIDSFKTDQQDIYEFLLKKYKAIKKEIDAVIKNKFIPTTFIK